MTRSRPGCKDVDSVRVCVSRRSAARVGIIEMKQRTWPCEVGARGQWRWDGWAKVLLAAAGVEGGGGGDEGPGEPGAS